MTSRTGEKRFLAVLPLCIAVLCLFCVLGADFPAWSDTAIYAVLGERLWLHGDYMLFGAPYSRHLPLHALLSYPFAHALGYLWGMKAASLAAGIGVLCVTFVLLRRLFSPAVAMVAVVLLTLHHGFVLIMLQGSGELLFAFLFLLSIFAYERAGDDQRWYLAVGAALGLSCLTRYNGYPVALFMAVWTCLRRPSHLRSKWLWAGGVLAVGLISIWFARNTLTFGSPFHTDYNREYSETTPGFFLQLFSNVRYYLNPLHTILFIPLVGALWGLWLYGSRRAFVLLCVLAVWSISFVWTTQGLRFLFPGFPILFGFAAAGLIDITRRFPRAAPSLAIALALTTVATDGAALCLYTYGACNAYVDRTIGVVPRYLGLSTEGFYAWNIARARLNATAESGATLVVHAPWDATVWRELFRPDMHVVDEQEITGRITCPSYLISQQASSGTIVFETSDAPTTYVLRRPCP